MTPLGSTRHQSVRAAIVGAGFMARTHATAVRAAGGTVTGAVGSSPERAAHAASVTGARQGYATIEALLKADDVDVVHICTPNSTHEVVALTALAAGKHLVCEKPLATSAVAAHRIVDEARSRGLIGTVPFVYRFHPMVREMKDRIQRGGLGTPSVVHGSYLQDWLANSEETNWRVDGQAGGASRAFADIGSHWCDLYEFVSADPIDRVSARFSTVIPSRGGSVDRVTTEDAVTMQFTTRSGVLGSVVVAQVAAGRKNRLEIELSGTEASFGFNQEDPERLWVGGTRANSIVMRDPAQLSPDAGRLAFLPAGHPQGYQDAFNAFVADSYAVMFGDNPGNVPMLDHGLRAAIICDAVVGSSRRDGGWVSVDEFERSPDKIGTTPVAQQ